MKTRFLVLTTAAALMIGAFAFAGTESDKQSPATDLDQLQKRITALESRIKSLERQLESPGPLNCAPQIQPRIQAQPPGSSGLLPLQDIFRPFVPPPEGNAQRPKIWGEGEINGWKYYVIPCAGGSEVSSEAVPLKVIPPK
jgi:hypothetical protein